MTIGAGKNAQIEHRIKGVLKAKIIVEKYIGCLIKRYGPFEINFWFFSSCILDEPVA